MMRTVVPFQSLGEPRTPPANIEAEQALLGAIMLNNDAFERIADVIEPHHFYDPVHASIFTALRDMVRSGGVANAITLRSYFAHADPIRQPSASDPGLTVPQYLGVLTAAATSIINAPDYARTVHQLWVRRQLIDVGEEMVNLAYNGPVGASPEVQLERAESALFEISRNGVGENHGFTTAEAVKSTIDMIAAAYENKGRFSGLPTGFHRLDRALGGLQPSDLIILAGRPSMGKAQALDAPVLLADGTWRPMGELGIGDRLASIDGAPSEVERVSPQGLRQMYALTFSDGRQAEADAEHLWEVYYRSWDLPRILTTAQIMAMLERKRYRGRLWVDRLSGHFGTHDAGLLDGYCLGTLIANGNLGRTTPLFTTPYQEIADEIARRLGVFGDEIRRKTDIDYSICGGSTTASLVALGLAGKLSHEKFIPKAYFQASRAMRAALLSGLLDGDGWVESFGTIRYATSSERLAKDVVALVRSLGGWATLATKQPTYTLHGERVDGRQSFVINMSFLGGGGEFFKVEFKRARTVGRTRRKKLAFVSIEPSRQTLAQCIAVSHPSALYITNDYVVTHNSAIAAQIAYQAAKDIKRQYLAALANPEPGGAKPRLGEVLFYSLEMSAEQLMMRQLAVDAEIGSTPMRQGGISEEQFKKIIAVGDRLSDAAPVFIDTTGSISVGTMLARARRRKRLHNTQLIVIDYLQLMVSGERAENRQAEVSKIASALKGMAKTLNVPVLALSQLSREVEKREDKRPMLSDLRESGAIEQDADIVMFVYRDEYYLGRSEPPEDSDKHIEWTSKMLQAKGKAEVIIGKHRHGSVQTVHMQFSPEYTRFADLDTYHTGGGQ